MIDSTPARDARFAFEQKLAWHRAHVDEALKPGIGRSLSTVFLDMSAVACNHACVFCDGRFYDAQPASFTTERLFELCLEMYDLGVESVIFVGEYSEPTLHPGFIQIARALGKLDMHRGIYTNGSAADPEIVRVLCNFNFVRVSLDAGNARTHRIIHRPDGGEHFDKALSFISLVAAETKGEVGVSFVLLPANITEVAQAARAARSSGADYFEIKPFYGPEYSFDASVFAAMRAELLSQLALCRALENPQFKILLNRQIQDALDSETADYDLTRVAQPRACLTSKLRLVVSPRGCFICPPYRGNLKKSLGDARATPLREIWHGARHGELLSELCNRRCVYHEQNEHMLAVRDGRAALPEANQNPPQAGFL
ncbi:MAG: radical SAM protein [Planctomycetes bacterium]|nr:radical SAM protein [Planctomycetota bacterium]